jgi:hypothetical protein
LVLLTDIYWILAGTPTYTSANAAKLPCTISQARRQLVEEAFDPKLRFSDNPIILFRRDVQSWIGSILLWSIPNRGH